MHERVLYQNMCPEMGDYAAFAFVSILFQSFQDDARVYLKASAYESADRHH